MAYKIHYHSDCDFFAGSENMLANVFNSEKLKQEFEICFSYRASDRYSAGLGQRARCDFPVYPTPIPNLDTLGWGGRSAPSRTRRIAAVLLQRLAYVPLLCWQIVKFWRLLSQTRPDILHVNNGGYPGALSCRAIVLAARLARVRKVVMVVNNLAVPYNRISRWMDFPIDRLVAASIDVFVTGSAAAAQRLADILRLPECKLHPIHNGITIRTANATPEETGKRLGLNDFSGVVFGIVALLEPRKGHRVLIDAVETLVNNYPAIPFKVLIEGDGPLREKLHAAVRSRKLDEVITFIGDEKHIFDFMAFIDVLILPSIRDEDFPNVILEAMSQSCPIIASRLAGTSEQVDDGVNGILIEAGNTAELARAMHRLATDANLLASMSQASNERFDRRFSCEIALRNYQSLYQGLLDSGRDA